MIHQEQKPKANLATKPEAGSIVKPNLTDIVKLPEFEINRKIGTPGQKEKLSFMSLIYQIQNRLKKFFSESNICDASIKSIPHDLSLRSYLEEKPDMNIASLRKILRPHFKEPNSSALFTALSNSRQAASESAQEYVMRLMSLRHKFYLALRRKALAIVRSLFKIVYPMPFRQDFGMKILGMSYVQFIVYLPRNYWKT